MKKIECIFKVLLHGLPLYFLLKVEITLTLIFTLVVALPYIKVKKLQTLSHFQKDVHLNKENSWQASIKKWKKFTFLR